MTWLLADQGVAACAVYVGPESQWVRFGSLFVILCLAAAGVAVGAATERAGWGKLTAIACIFVLGAVGAVDWRMGELERAVSGLCGRAPLMLDTEG